MKKSFIKETRKSILIFFILLIGLLFSPLYSLASTITFGANESPPFWSKTLDNDGMCGELVHAISNAVGLTSKIEFSPLKRLIDDDSNNDLGNPVFYMKNQSFAAVIPIAIYDVSFNYYKPHHKEGINISRVSDLKGYKIGVLKGTLADHSYFERAGVVFQTSYSQDSLVKKMKLGRIDLSLEISLVAQTSIDKVFPDNSHDFKSITINNSNSPIAVMIAEDLPNAKDISEKFRAGLKIIVENGQYKKIIEKYYGEGKIPKKWFENLSRFQQLYYFE